MTLCPFCGAYSTRACDLIEDAGSCPWEEMDELDPDRLREDRDERAALARKYPDDE